MSCVSKPSKKAPAANRKQKFKAEYTVKWPFIVPSSKDEFRALCSYCRKDFSVHGGRSDCGQHVNRSWTIARTGVATGSGVPTKSPFLTKTGGATRTGGPTRSGGTINTGGKAAKCPLVHRPFPAVNLSKQFT